MFIIKITVRAVGVLRDIFGKRSIDLEVYAEDAPTVFNALSELDILYDGKLNKMIFNQDNTLNEWSRVMLNGRDVRFLDKESLYLKDGDIILLMPQLGGG